MSGGGGPDDPVLAFRVGKIEEQLVRLDATLDKIDERLRALEKSVAELTGIVRHLPTTWVMVTAMIGGQITLAGLLFGAIKLFAAK